ncbi:MAG: cytochrome c [Rhodospirillales bacterium]
MFSLVAALAVAPMVVTAAAAGQSGAIDATREAYLANLLVQDCGSCHGMTMKGGLGPPLLPEALAGMGDDVLVEAILDGRPGTPMPPWRFELTREDAEWLVVMLRAGRQ